VSTFELNREGASSFQSLFCAMSGYTIQWSSSQRNSTVFKTAGFTLKLFTFVHLFRGTLSQKATFTPKNPIVMLYNKEQVEYK
jgi:hypothetical protein